MSHDLMHHVDVEDFKKQFLQLNNRNYGYGSTPVESCDPATQEVVKGNKQIGGRPATTKSQHPSTYCSSSLPLPSSPHSDKQLDVPGRCLLIDQIRAQDLKRLHGQAYLDYGGAGFYSERQLDEAMADLRTQLLMNPHSSSSEVTHGGGALDNDVNELRHLTLEMLNAPAGEYAVVLTGGATAALKMVGECFPWSTRSTFTYTLHNHNSVLGIREYALAAESQVYVIDLEQQQQQTEHNPTQQKSVSQQLGPYRINHIQTLRAPGSCCQTSTKKCGNSGTRPFSGSHTFMPPGRGGDDKQACRSNDAAAPLHLFAMPSECNFSGVKYDLSVADAARKNGLEGLHMALHAAPSAGCRTCSSISSSSICVCVPTAPDPASDVVSSSSAEVTSPSGEAASEGSAAAAAAASSDRSNRAEGRCLVLLDASKGCATSPPDLSAHPVDFLVLSYYKIFGYPTGLGALVVRKDALRLLRQPYFAGGTVLAVSADGYDVHRRGGAACWEYGTLPFTAISAACHGFAFIRHLGGFSAISRHSGCLAEYLAQKLMDLRHENGTTVVEMYGAWVPAGTAALADGGSSSSGAGGVQHVQVREATDLPRGTQGANIYDDWKQGAGAGGLKAAGSRAMNQQPLLGMLTGPTVTFNLLQPDGTYVGYGEVQTVAKLHGIHLRVGCFCNPGACAKMLGLSCEFMIRNACEVDLSC
ncbi:hypothetical protein CEUSTIGMA_g12670.t1 [Chlamydomonas eustigma]|uniref:Aminotransferase class V domain-containing protein n=1 Tax=Chlamydomonas eustigma TaxID=1157962 RepID=A0A250XR19_9CHLO|nr:hypothetical protein CEUSTIGMA_g12670.t1 [Chlamydomonas eustigma]|eukprot:GAX85250.1 hypothetical protein CEUSTIGMA_g12670.t1 [Chlamydomonas eustigma]